MDSMTSTAQNCSEAVVNTTVKVRVHATWDDVLGKVVFGIGGTVEPTGTGEVRGHTIKINRNAGPAEIQFKLKDDTKPDLDLEFRREDPIQLEQRDQCAEAECPSGPGMAGFQLLDCSGTKLRVQAPANSGEYVYSLWFVDRNGRTHDYDPIIKNRL